MQEVRQFNKLMKERQALPIREQVYHATMDEFKYLDILLRRERISLIENLNEVFNTKGPYYETKRRIVERKLGIVGNLININEGNMLNHYKNNIDLFEKKEEN